MYPLDRNRDWEGHQAERGYLEQEKIWIYFCTTLPWDHSLSLWHQLAMQNTVARFEE